MNFAKIIHISDIHIRLLRRHDEYSRVFETLYAFIDEQVSKQPCILAITGDVLHSKTELSPECILTTVTFLRELCKRIPTFLIAGNHDVNLSNERRMDALTPIVDAVGKQTYPLVYANKTGVYIMRNIAFNVLHVCDDISKFRKYFAPDKVSVAVYHGNRSDVISKLDADIVLLGDIHLQQKINQHSAYAGSLIQQNFGESEDGHGGLIWDLEAKTFQPFLIPNDTVYVTLELNNNKDELR